MFVLILMTPQCKGGGGSKVIRYKSMSNQLPYYTPYLAHFRDQHSHVNTSTVNLQIVANLKMCTRYKMYFFSHIYFQCMLARLTHASSYLKLNM